MTNPESDQPPDRSRQTGARLKRDVLAGLMFIAFGLWGLAAAADLEAGTLAEMGPAYFPRIVCTILILLGTGILLTGAARHAPGLDTSWTLRPIAMVSLASLAFAVLLERTGIVVALTTTVVIGVLAGERLKLIPLIALTATLILASIALFVWALGMRIPVWPRVAGL